jgi:hypothetical protein
MKVDVYAKSAPMAWIDIVAAFKRELKGDLYHTKSRPIVEINGTLYTDEARIPDIEAIMTIRLADACYMQEGALKPVVWLVVYTRRCAKSPFLVFDVAEIKESCTLAKAKIGVSIYEAICGASKKVEVSVLQSDLLPKALQQYGTADGFTYQFSMDEPHDLVVRMPQSEPTLLSKMFSAVAPLNLNMRSMSGSAQLRRLSSDEERKFFFEYSLLGQLLTRLGID